MNPAYTTVNIFDEGRFVMALDFDDKNEALRESLNFQEDGFATEMLHLSRAALFDMSPEEEHKRLAY